MECNRLIYLDHSATTPVRPEVLEVMLPYFSECYGNPSSLYPLAERSYRAIEGSREQVAAVLNCHPAEVVFTSGGTESDNAAIIGVARALKHRGNHIITSSVEHHAVLNVCRYLEREGFQVTYLPVDRYGFVDPDYLAQAVTEQTILVSIMYANNEIGTIEPIKDLSSAVKGRAEALGHAIPFHTDAVQAAGHLDLDVEKLEIDSMSLSAHKFYGPKGCGILHVRRGTSLEAIQLGGGQEQGRRSGTENVAAIVGTSMALQLASDEREAANKHCSDLRDALIQGIIDCVDGAHLNGHPTSRLPNNAHFTFGNMDGEALVLGLAAANVAASTGSACSTGSPEPSHVLLAIGVSREIAWNSLRLTLGVESNEEDIRHVIQAIVSVIQTRSDTLVV